VSGDVRGGSIQDETEEGENKKRKEAKIDGGAV
jgi:hypothetical protein